MLAQMSLRFIAVQPFSRTRGDSAWCSLWQKPASLETEYAPTVYTNGAGSGCSHSPIAPHGTRRDVLVNIDHRDHRPLLLVNGFARQKPHLRMKSRRDIVGWQRCRGTTAGWRGPENRGTIDGVQRLFIDATAKVAELADALDLGSSAARRAGSSPVPGTSIQPLTC